MLFSYGTTLCLMAVCCSGAAARPGPYTPRSYSNTTSTSSTTTSSSLDTTQKRIPLGTGGPSTSSSPTVVTSPGPVAIYSPSATNSSSSTQWSSSSTTSLPTSTPSVTSGRNSSTVSITHSGSYYIHSSSASSSRSFTRNASITSNSTLSTSTSCHPLTTIDWTGSRCISYCAVTTSYRFATNTTQTVTQLVTVYGNSTSFQRSIAPGPTSTQKLPLQPCQTPVIYNTQTSALITATPSEESTLPVSSVAAPTLTIMYVTSKKTVTNFVTVPPISFHGVSVQDKSTVNPNVPVQKSNTDITPSSGPQQQPPQSLQQATTANLGGPKSNPAVALTPTPSKTNNQSPPGTTQIPNNPNSNPTSVVVNGVPIVLPGNSVIIGGTTLSPNAGATTVITVNGQVFTVNPSQIIAPGTTLGRPTPNPGAIITSAPTPTVVNGVTVAVGPSIAIIDSSTYNIGPGASPSIIVVHGQTITLGPSGVAIGSTTLQAANAGPAATAPPTRVATINGIAVTEIGSTLLVIGSHTLTLPPGPAASTTATVDGQTFSIGPGGVAIIGGSISPSTTLFTPNALSTAPAAAATRIFTVAGVAFTEIGSSLVVIAGTTFTVGPGTQPTTDVVSGVTISIGPGGVGFAGASTTVPLGGPVATAATTTGLKIVTTNGAPGTRAFNGGSLLALCVLLGAWVLF